MALAVATNVTQKINQRGNFKEFSGGAGSNVFKQNKEGVFIGGTNFSNGLIRFSYNAVMRVGSGTGPGISLDGSGGTLGLTYDGTATGTIDGYTTEGAETSYIRITAASGMSIKLKNSYTESTGDFRPAADITYSLGNANLRWHDVYAENIVAWGTGSKFSCRGNDGIDAGFDTADGKRANFKGGILYSLS